MAGRLFRRLALGTGLALITAIPLAAETLSDTLIQAYRTSPLLEQQRYLLRATDEDVAIAVAALRPTVSFQSSYGKTVTFTDRQRVRQTNPLDGVQTSINVGGRETTTIGALSLVLDYVLADGGQRHLRIGAAKEAVIGARFNLTQVEQQVLLDAVSAYLNLRLAVRLVDVRQTNVRLIDQQLSATQDRFEVGEVTRTDVAIAQSRLAAARSALAAARGQVDIARETYRLATGTLPGSTLADPPPPPALPPSVERAQQLALQIDPLVAAAQHDITALTILAEARAADRLPTVSLQANAGRQSPDTDSLNLSLRGTMPVYTGGQLPALQRQAIARAQAARGDLGNTSRQIVEAVGRAYAGLEVARAQITATQEGVRASELAFEGLREEATLGVRTTLDVLDAENDLLVARTDLLTAQSDAQLAVYQVLASIGLLTTEHLGLSVERYDPSVYYSAAATAPQDTTLRPSERGGRLDSVLRRFNRN